MTKSIKEPAGEAKLRIITGPLRGQDFPLSVEGWAKSIGRKQEQADFCLPDSAISRRHAEFSFRDGQWMVRDLNSSNGTFINEQRITAPTLLRHQDQIRCGSTVLQFELAEPAGFPPQADTKDQLIELVFDPGETMVSVAFDSLQSKQAACQQQRMIEAGQAALNLSHGIKNILQAVNSGMDVVDMSFQNHDFDQAQKGWNILKRNVNHIQKLVLDMLKFSKDQPPNFQACQINRLVETVVETVRPQAVERNVALTTQLDEHLEMVMLDPDNMHDVLLNVLLNAMEASRPQTGQVTITTEQDLENNRLRIRIQDNGEGIVDTNVIFEPFHSTRGRVGTGLGLPIARKIVQQHEGTIQVESLAGEGSIFTIDLPLKVPD